MCINIYITKIIKTITKITKIQFYKYTYEYIYIQGVPGGMCNTSGGCSLGQTIPI